MNSFEYRLGFLKKKEDNQQIIAEVKSKKKSK